MRNEFGQYEIIKEALEYRDFSYWYEDSPGVFVIPVTGNSNNLFDQIEDLFYDFGLRWTADGFLVRLERNPDPQSGYVYPDAVIIEVE